MQSRPLPIHQQPEQTVSVRHSVYNYDFIPPGPSSEWKDGSSFPLASTPGRPQCVISNGRSVYMLVQGSAKSNLQVVRIAQESRSKLSSKP